LKKSIVEILKDDERLTEYIQSLEEDINKTEDMDEKLDLILDNVLKNCDDFKDRRALKSTLIESVTELIKLRTELPMKRIQSKKQILDIMTKKEELEIKKAQAKAQATIAGETVDMLTYLYTVLDDLHIHPKHLDESILEAECIDIIDTVAVEEEIEEKENKIEEVKVESDETNLINVDTMIEEAISESKINILDLQAQLDN